MQTMQNTVTTTIKAGFLVSLSTAISGNATYKKQTIEAPHFENGALKEKWSTDKTVIAPDEMELAKKARSRVTSIIRGVCSQTKGALLCPKEDGEALDRAIGYAREVAREFNRNAFYTRLDVYTYVGVISADDEETIRSLNAEIRGLLDEMSEGVKSLDANAIRDAANRAKGLGSMLSPEAAERVQTAIDTARKAARIIVKSGELAASQIDQETLAKLTSARGAFLDLDGDDTVAMPEATARAVDMMPQIEPLEVSLARGWKAPEMEIE
jgi:hypothetical protein